MRVDVDYRTVIGSLGIGLLTLPLAVSPNPARDNITQEGFHRPGLFGTTLGDRSHFTILLPTGQSSSDTVLMIEAYSGPGQDGCSGNTWDYAFSSHSLDDDAVGSWGSSGVLYDSNGHRVSYYGYSTIGLNSSRLIADTTYILSDFLGSGGAAALPDLPMPNHSLYLESTSSTGAAFAQGSRTTSLEFTQQIPAAQRGTGSTLYCDITFDVKIVDGALEKGVVAARPAHWEVLGTSSYQTDSDGNTAITDVAVVSTGKEWSDTRSIASDLWNGVEEGSLNSSPGESWPTSKHYPTDSRLLNAYSACSAFRRIKSAESDAGGMYRLW